MPTIVYKNKAGKRVPGVTTVISGSLGWNKAPLMYWANQQGLEGKRHTDTVKDAQDAGSLGHSLVEEDIQKVLKQKDIVVDLKSHSLDIQNMAKQSFENYLIWKNAYKFEPLFTEVSMMNEEIQTGGCLDCLGLVNSQPCLVDWKTGKDVYPDHLIQGSTYIWMWNQDNTLILVDGEWIRIGNFREKYPKITGGYHGLRFDKETAGFDHKHRQEVVLNNSFEAFKHLRGLHALKKFIK